MTVTRTNVGDGWWEGFNSRHKYGLFSEAYVMAQKETDAKEKRVLRSSQTAEKRKITHTVILLWALVFFYSVTFLL